MTILRDLFGPGTWGTGGNMVAWVICGVIGFSWLHAKEKARHLAKMAQAATHHQEQLDQAAAHHKAQMDLLRKQHSQLSDQVADAQVNAGAGSNPADQGLAADQRVAPPAATESVRLDVKVTGDAQGAADALKKEIRRLGGEGSAGVRM